MTTDATTIRCDQFIGHPPAVVWKALTEPDLHARWWARGDVKPVVGHRFTLDMGAWGQQCRQVLAVEPERMIRYSFAEGSLDTTVTWRLQPEGNGTRLFLEHAGFDPESPLGKSALAGMGDGWPRVLRAIEPCLAGVVTA